MKDRIQIGYIGGELSLIQLYDRALREWNKLNPDKRQYELSDDSNKGVIFISVKQESDVDFIIDKLNKNEHLHVFALISLDVEYLKHKINNLIITHPFAVIKTDSPPIQPGKVWEFLELIEEKPAHLDVEFEWEEGDLDDIQ